MLEVPFGRMKLNIPRGGVSEGLLALNNGTRTRLDVRRRLEDEGNLEQTLFEHHEEG